MLRKEEDFSKASNRLQLLRYLEMLNIGSNCPPEWQYKNIAHFLQQNGKFMDKHLPSPVKMEDKQCFRNALHYAQENGLYYCEGFAVAVIPCLHAWCLTPQGEVIDPTWEARGLIYYGAIFTVEWATAFTFERGYYGILDSYELVWPLISGKRNYRKEVLPQVKHLLKIV